MLITQLCLFTAAAVAPVNVKSTAVDSTIISVKWEGLTPCRLINGHIVEYRVQYEAQSGGVMGSKEVSGNWSSGGETDLTGLTPFTNYSIAVAAVNEQGAVGLYSDTIFIETHPGPEFETGIIAKLWFSQLNVFRSVKRRDARATNRNHHWCFTGCVWSNDIDDFNLWNLHYVCIVFQVSVS